VANLLVHHKVEDYNKWKPFFDEHSSFRTQNGSKGESVFRSKNNPNEIFILFEWDNIENAQKFVQSDSLKEVMKDAGVIGMPEVHFLEEVTGTIE
jgi:heme-degrading monooxygenase HmoA